MSDFELECEWDEESARELWHTGQEGKRRRLWQKEDGVIEAPKPKTTHSIKDISRIAGRL
jgi:hypothetical protein